MVMKERVGSFFRVNRWLLVSLIALGAAVYVSTRYVDSVLSNAPHPGATSAVQEEAVVVVRTAVPAYEVVTAADVGIEQMPVGDVPVGAYTQVSQVVGQWTQEAIAPGLPIVSSDVFQPKSANILAARIHPGDMAVDLPLGANSVVDGLVEPGDTISLFTTITEKTGQQVTEDFLNSVKVLAVDGNLSQTTPPQAGQNLTLILALPPSQVAKLLFTQQKGAIEAVLDAPNAVTVPPKPFGTTQWEQPVP